MARSPITRPAAPNPTAATSSAVTNQGDASSPSCHGSAKRPGSGGCAALGPSSPVTTTSEMLTAIAPTASRPGGTAGAAAMAGPDGLVLTPDRPAWRFHRSLDAATVAQSHPAYGESRGHVGVLPQPVDLGVQVAAGHPVLQVHLDLLDPHSEAEQVDEHRCLHSPTVGERLGGCERGASDAPLPGQRLCRLEAGQSPYAVPRQSHDEAETAALALLRRQNAHGHVRGTAPNGLDEGCTVLRCLLQIRVEEEKIARSAQAVPGVQSRDNTGTGRHRGGLTPVPGVYDDQRACLSSGPPGAVSRTVVDGDDYIADRLRRSNRRCDPVSLVLRWNDHRDVGAGAGAHAGEA